MFEGGYSLPLTCASSSSTTYFSHCEDRVASSNLNLCDTSNNNNNNNPTKSPVTVIRENESNLILNEIPLSSNDIILYNVHDYAIFIQSNLLPQWWFIKIRERPPVKNINTFNNSSKLWAKVRAVTYMTTLGHRTGSWYSDDQTEYSPMDDDNASSLSDSDEKADLSKIEFHDVNTYIPKSELAVPLRRSFSSVDYTKRASTHSPALSRSRSATVINSSDRLSDPSPIDLSTSLSPPPPPPPPSPATSSQPLSQSSFRVYRFLHCIIL